MIDPYQAASVSMQLPKKNNKLKRAYINAMVGMIVAVAGTYIVNVIINLLEKKKFNEIFLVSSTWQLYFASVIAGGLNGILVVFLPPKLYRFAAVILITVIYETIAGLTNATTLNNQELVKNIVRDLFLIFFIVDLYKKLFKDYSKKTPKKDEEETELNELLNVALISSIVLNIGIVTTKSGLESILTI